MYQTAQVLFLFCRGRPCPDLSGWLRQKTPDVVAYTETARQSDEAPNIVLIVANQLGYGDLACYGQKLIQTPNMIV